MAIQDETQKKSSSKVTEIYNTIFDNSHIGLAICDSEGFFIDANPQCLKIFGIPRIGKVKGYSLFEEPNLSEMFKEKLKSGKAVMYKSVFNFEKIKQLNLFETEKSGTIDVAYQISPIVLQGQSNLEGYIIYVQDISDKIQEQKECLSHEIKFQEIFNNVNDGIVITDPSTRPGRFLEVNRVFCERLGYTKSELLEMSTMDTNTGEFNPPLQEIYETLEKYNSATFKNVDLTKDGTRIPVEVNTYLFSLNGRHVLLSVSRDIRDRIQFIKQVEENDSLLNTLLTNLPLVLYQINSEGFFTKSEGAGLVHRGLKEHIRIGVNVFEAWPEFTDKFQRALRGENVRFEAHREINGKMMSYLTFLMPDNNAERGIIGIVINLSEQEDLKRKLIQSEEKYRSLIDQANDGIIIIQDDKMVLINHKFARMLGYTIDELQDRSNFDLVHPDVSSELNERRKRRLRGEQVESIYETILVKKDGDSLDVELNVDLIDYEGKQAFLSFVRDITDRKRAERRIKESERKYRMIIETAQEGVFLLDSEQRITYANQQFSEMIGYSLENLIGHSIYEYIRTETHKKIKLLINRITKGTKESFDFPFHRRDGSIFWGLLQTNPIFDEKGRIKGILGMILDISDRKKMEEQTRKQLLKFNVEGGYVYLVKESSSTLSLSVFKDLCQLGYQCLAFSRTLERDFQKNIDTECRFYWLAQKGNLNSIQPDLNSILSEIEKQNQRSVVLIDRLDFLIQKNGFKDVLNFIYELKEIAYTVDLIILLSIDPQTLTNQELHLLEKETSEIETRSLDKIPEDMLSILRFVYHKNNSGVKPAYSDLGTEFQISRPTTRKRIKTLVATGYLSEYRFGIRKILEVTEKGRAFFLD